MINPYIAGSVVRSTAFYGRVTLIRSLLDQHVQSIYLVGGRRMGKTSLLFALQDKADKANETNEIAFFLNMQGSGDNLIELGQDLVRQIKRSSETYHVLHEVKPKDPADVCDVIITLDEIAMRHDLHILLLWDEADALLLLDDAFLMRLRGALQNRKYVRNILAATKRLSELRDRCASWPAPFLDGFATRRVSPLDKIDAKSLICQSQNAPEGQVEVSTDLLAQIMAITGNSPYLIQHLCNRLFLPDSRLREIQEDDLLLDDALADLFQIDYNYLTRPERAIMRRLTSSDWMSLDEIHKAVRLQKDRTRRRLDSLIELGYVWHEDGHYRVASHFLRSWLKGGRVKETRKVLSDKASLARPAGPTAGERQRLKEEYDGLSATYLELSKKIGLQDLQISRTLNLVQKNTYETERIEWADRRREIDIRMSVIERKLGL